MPDQRLPFLDALRGWAVLAVLIFHLTWRQPPPTAPAWFYPSGITGGTAVQLFFIISAFTLSLAAAKRPAAALGRRYYLRRLARIMPLYGLWVLIYFWLDPLQNHPSYDWQTVFINLTFLNNWMPQTGLGVVVGSWSLAVEFWFYLLFPWLFRHLNTLAKAFGWFVGSCVLTLLLSVLWQWMPVVANTRIVFLDTSVLMHLPAFLLGIVLFLVYQRYQAQPKASTNGLARALLAFSLLLLIWFRRLPPSTAWDFVIVRLLYGGVLLGLAFAPIPLLVNRVSCFYGRISYSFYLLHIACVYGWFRPLYISISHLPLSTTLQFGLSVLISLAIITPLAWLSQKWIEEPSLKWLTQLASPPSTGLS